MVKVESISKFGFVADGKIYKYSEVSTPRINIVPGADIELETSGTATALSTDIVPLSEREVDTDRAKKFTPTYTKKVDADKMSKAEWSAKDRSQLIGGLSHDAATITATMLTLQVYNNAEEVLNCYKQLLEGMLKIRNEIK